MALSKLAQARCEVCGGWFPRTKLLRQLRAWMQHPGQNLLPYSEYDSNGWSSTATSDGNTVMGCRALESYVSIASDGTTTSELAGAPSFKGDGTLTASDTVDLSGLSGRVTMQAVFSPHHADCGDQYTVVFGVKKGGNSYPIASDMAVAAKRVRGAILVSTIDVADRSALTPYITVTAPDSDARWAVERIQLWDWATYGDTYIRTTGTAVTRTSSSTVTGAVVVCPCCRDPRLDRVEDYQHEKYEPAEIAEDLELE